MTLLGLQGPTLAAQGVPQPLAAPGHRRPRLRRQGPWAAAPAPGAGAAGERRRMLLFSENDYVFFNDYIL